MCRRTSMRWYVEHKDGHSDQIRAENGIHFWSDKRYGVRPTLYKSPFAGRKAAQKCNGVVRYYIPPRTHPSGEIPF